MSNRTKWAIGIGGGFVFLFVVMFVWFSMTQPAPVTETLPPGAQAIVLDSEWYEILWKRWTVTDWILGLLAAGTAVTAAVKNAFSSHNTNTGGTTGTASTQVDRAVMLFAALSVVATTLDAKMHPAQMAERYRQGDLLLQDAIMDYRLSAKTEADLDALRLTWHQAQKILEGAPAVPAQPSTKVPDRQAPANPAQPGGKGKPADQQPAAAKPAQPAPPAASSPSP